MSALSNPSQIAASSAGHAQTDLAAQSGDKSAATNFPEAAEQVYYQEPEVEADCNGGVMHDVGCVEGSQAHLPSDRAENKPGAPAVIAGAFHHRADGGASITMTHTNIAGHGA